MGEPVSTALCPRTRPSVPATHVSPENHEVMREGLCTVHGNTSHNILTQMLLLIISFQCAFELHPCIPYRDFKRQLHATIIGCECIEDRREGIGVELDCTAAMCQLLFKAIVVEAVFGAGIDLSHTVNNSTNDLMDLSFFRRVCGGPSLCNSWSSLSSEGLEGASGDGRSSKGRPAQGTGNAAVEVVLVRGSPSYREAPKSHSRELTNLLSMFADDREGRMGGQRGDLSCG